MESTFGGPGNASWVLAAYNPSPGNSAAVKQIRLARIRRVITAAGTVRVTFKLKGRKADKLRRQVRRARLRSLRVTTTITDASGRTTSSRVRVKLR